MDGGRMNSKILIGISLALIIVVGSIAIFTFDVNDDSLTTAEIDRLEKEQNQFPVRASFTGGNMGFLEEWCANNEGFWTGAETVKRGECAFETRTQYHLASAVLDELQQPEITGETAQELCRFLALECFSNSSFDGYYQLSTGKTFVNYDYKGTLYKFDVSDENNITFTVDGSQESIVLSESKTLDDEFSIMVNTGYDYYQLGDKIAISGTVRDNHHILSQAKFDFPVIIQIITEGELKEVAQLELREDGRFQYIVNTDGLIWTPGKYKVMTTYDTYATTTTFDMGKESRNLIG